MNKYYINSNNGDYIIEMDGKYSITILSHKDENDKYVSQTTTTLTKGQFLAIEGFVPIKQKKLFSMGRYHKNKSLAKNEKRTIIPTVQEIRDNTLTKILKK